MNIPYKNILIRSVTRLSAALSVFLVIGCAAVGPDYVRPEVPISTDWHSELKNGLSAEEIDTQTLSSWWTTFNDSILTDLIDKAVAGNLDLKNAEARVREARASRGIAEAGMFPYLNFSGSDTWTHSSRDTGTGKTSQLFTSGFDAGWELDIFGGTRRSIEVAEANLRARTENLRDVLVTLLAEVAMNYVDIRTYQARLAAVQKNLKAQNETYQLTLWRSQAGLSDELAVQQARYNLESTRSQIPSLNTELEKAKNSIAVLIGVKPGDVHQVLSQTEPIPVASPTIAVGVPADVIRRRPDVRQAEQELAAQTAQIGVTTSELYPKFTLNGSIGVEASSINRLISNVSSPGTRILSGGPKVSWALFDAGAIRQNIKVQSAIQEQKLIAYESTILAALEDAENALVAYANEQDRNYNLTEAVDAAQMAAEMAQQEYEAGLVDFSNVLDAQRSLLSFQDELAQSNGTMSSNFIRLYKALGGGWTSFASEDNKK